ncbi:MAG TPA: MBL fold metallo-hydrolase [Planococcus sp. (in: firmicutes)]|nr:MBL fold metallo-hydrolase [Planococcus sp. (in: firmicutes)]
MRSSLKLLLILWTGLLIAACQPIGENSAAEPVAVPSGEERVQTGLKAHFIDAGQADAAYFEFDEYSVLIDAGNWNNSAVVDYLNGLGVTAIDIVIGTHPDADHIGQMDQVIEEFEVGEVWMSGNASSSNTFLRVMEAIDVAGVDYYEPRSGEQFDVGSLQIDVLYPQEVTGKANEESISLKLIYDEVRFVFTGDAGVSGEQEMIDSGINLQADILQLGHHGSNTSTSTAFLKAVSPEVAVYSAGADNSYGHPHAEVIAATENEGAEVFGTDVNGTIIIETDGVVYEVKTEKDGVPKEGVNRCIDINIASSAELQEIRGIGPAYAEAILNQRPFETLDDLTNINGIGEATLDNIKEQGLACIGG